MVAVDAESKEEAAKEAKESFIKILQQDKDVILHVETD